MTREDREESREVAEDLVTRAASFAEARHNEQRYGDRPYRFHLDAVAAVLARFGHRSPELQAAAYLHDVVEDTETTLEEVEGRFGAQVAQLVHAVTSEEGPNRKERNAKTYPKIRALAEGTILKLADRIANVEHSLRGDGRLLGMYRSEFKDFKEALYRPGECEEMWAYLEGLLAQRPHLSK